jgi:hypothetical protein
MSTGPSRVSKPGTSYFSNGVVLDWLAEALHSNVALSQQ